MSADDRPVSRAEHEAVRRLARALAECVGVLWRECAPPEPTKTGAAAWVERNEAMHAALAAVEALGQARGAGTDESASGKDDAGITQQGSMGPGDGAEGQQRVAAIKAKVIACIRAETSVERQRLELEFNGLLASLVGELEQAKATAKAEWGRAVRAEHIAGEQERALVEIRSLTGGFATGSWESQLNAIAARALSSSSGEPAGEEKP